MALVQAHNKSIWLLLLAALLAAFPGSAQEHTAAGLTYAVRKASGNAKNPPLLLLLHGYGSNEQDLFGLAPQLPGKFLIVSARAPITLSAGSYAWYPVHFVSGTPVSDAAKAEEARKKILEFLTALKAQRPYDDREIYLLGFSQGAILCYSLGLTEPARFKGIAVMSGRLLPEIKPRVAPASKLAALSIFISHGTVDKVLDLHYAQDAVAFLASRGVRPTYHEYPGVGHGISPEMLADVKTWLQKND